MAMAGLRSSANLLGVLQLLTSSGRYLISSLKDQLTLDFKFHPCKSGQYQRHHLPQRESHWEMEMTSMGHSESSAGPSIRVGVDKSSDQLEVAGATKCSDVGLKMKKCFHLTDRQASKSGLRRSPGTSKVIH